MPELCVCPSDRIGVPVDALTEVKEPVELVDSNDCPLVLLGLSVNDGSCCVCVFAGD